MSGLTVASWPAYRFLRRQARSGIPISLRIFHILLWSTQSKGFDIINKAEVDVFLELSCFFDDPTDVGNLISDSSAFLNPVWISGHSRFTNCWYLAWRIFSITLLMSTLTHTTQQLHFWIFIIEKWKLMFTQEPIGKYSNVLLGIMKLPMLKSNKVTNYW